MAWKIKKIWCDHTPDRGKHKGTTLRAEPLFDTVRGGYDTYPTGNDSSNELDDSETAASIEELYDHLGRGRGVRCLIPLTGEKSILTKKFSVTFEQV